MLIRSRLKKIPTAIKMAGQKVVQSVKKSADWLSRGYIVTKVRNVADTVGQTFAQSTHGGYLSTGMVRSSDTELAVYLSDVDGTDLSEEVKTYIAELKKHYPDMSPPVKMFTASGIIGMYARTEMMYVMVYGGIPYIMPVHRVLDGLDENDARFETATNRIVATLGNKDSNHVISLGFVESNVNVNEYVLDYAKKSPMFDSADIDANLVKMAIKNGTISSMGSLYLPGGYLYDIYAIDPVLSRTLRPYRDFTQAQAELPQGREVILLGGDPEIVYVGAQYSQSGFLYDIWVPNDARYYNRAKKAVADGILPLGQLVVDDDEYLESYAILIKILRELDEEVNGPADEEAAPDIIVNGDDTDTDEVPVLIDLPEYLM